jgi:RNA methyltransferase, TrmH family
VQKRATRWATRVFVAEGPEVVRTGLDAGCVPEALYLAAEGAHDPVAAALAERAGGAGARVYELAPGVMAKVADTVTPQPVLAVFGMLDVPSVPASAGFVVVMVDVRDPGNAGTVLRTADAAGVGAVVAAGGTVDPYNPKTVRASAGSIFHVPLTVVADPVAALEGLVPRRRLGAAVRDGEDYAAVDWCQPSALVLGNEAAGLAPGLPLDGTVSIPMAGSAESLNVGMACAVLCFEALRQRRSTMPR